MGRERRWKQVSFVSQLLAKHSSFCSSCATLPSAVDLVDDISAVVRTIDKEVSEQTEARGAILTLRGK